MVLAIKQNQKYTFADYDAWPEDERWEIIEAAIIKRVMSGC